MRRILIGLLLCVSCISCRNPKIGYANVEELIYSIKLTEMYIKKYLLLLIERIGM